MQLILTLFWAFMGVIGILGLISGFLSIISLCILFGYVLVRIVLRIMGLYSGSGEQVAKELMFAAICGMLVLLTIACYLIMIFVAYTTGIGD